MRKYIRTLAIISFTSLSLISVFGIKQNSKLVHADFACEHSGYHYEELLPEIGAAGHKEFWACCKCHEAFLEKPEKGVFTDQDDSLMTGEIDEEHIAYIGPLEFKSLTLNGRRYFPVFHDTDIPEGLTFYDGGKQEIEISNAENPMTDLRGAEYYTLAGEGQFYAVSYIASISYNTVYGDGGTGLKNPNPDFIKNNLSDVEVIEGLTNEANPATGNTPRVCGVDLNEIWQSYRDVGFCSSNNGFWSCCAYNQVNAYCFNMNYLMWVTAARSSASSLSICLSTIFE